MKRRFYLKNGGKGYNPPKVHDTAYTIPWQSIRGVPSNSQPPGSAKRTISTLFIYLDKEFSIRIIDIDGINVHREDTCDRYGWLPFPLPA